jgi:hypothetical protein
MEDKPRQTTIPEWVTSLAIFMLSVFATTLILLLIELVFAGFKPALHHFVDAVTDNLREASILKLPLRWFHLVQSHAVTCNGPRSSCEGFGYQFGSWFGAIVFSPFSLLSEILKTGSTFETTIELIQLAIGGLIAGGILADSKSDAKYLYWLLLTFIISSLIWIPLWAAMSAGNLLLGSIVGEAEAAVSTVTGCVATAAALMPARTAEAGVHHACHRVLESIAHRIIR